MEGLANEQKLEGWFVRVRRSYLALRYVLALTDMLRHLRRGNEYAVYG